MRSVEETSALLQLDGIILVSSLLIFIYLSFPNQSINDK